MMLDVWHLSLDIWRINDDDTKNVTWDEPGREWPGDDSFPLGFLALDDFWFLVAVDNGLLSLPLSLLGGREPSERKQNCSFFCYWNVVVQYMHDRPWSRYAHLSYGVCCPPLPQSYLALQYELVSQHVLDQLHSQFLLHCLTPNQ